MGSTTAAFLATCAAIVVAMAALRRLAATRGNGRLAQLEFARRHGARVGDLLGGSRDPRRGSPWIAVRVGGRPARLVAAPLGGGQLQAGIELLEHELGLDVFHTTGDRDELELPPGTDEDAVNEVVTRLRELEVDNVARPTPGAHHVLRVRFTDVEQLPGRIAAIAPLLEELERLAPADQAPNDWAQ